MRKTNLWTLLMLLAMTFSMAACSDKEDDGTDSPDETKPSTPVKDSDWQIVPANGGTIEKGDIALTFSSGTFDTDTKVAITDIKKGNIGGELEASPFYQITLPATIAKPITVKIKSADTNNDISYIVRTPGWAASSNKAVQNENYLETTYVDGAYTTTFPACDNGEDPGNVSFTIGLGHVPSLDTRSLVNKALKSGKVGDVTWEIYMSWEAWRHFDYDSLFLVKIHTDQIGQSIEDAIKKIHKLGFKLNGSGRTIPYYYSLTKEWGEHEQDWLNNNRFSSIKLNCKDIAGVKSVIDPMPSEFNQTIIHETLHYYQSDYDPRYWSIRKWGDDEHLVMAEMGAVWIEKLMNNGQVNANFQINTNGLANCFENHFRLGVSREEKDIQDLYSFGGKPYQQYGYALAPLLEYMIKKKKMEDANVHSLYSSWKNENSGYIGGSFLNKTTVERLNDWYDSTFSFFTTEHVDDYYVSLFKGDLMKGDNNTFSIAHGAIRQYAKILNNKLVKDSLLGKVYPNGCEGVLIGLKNFSENDMADYEFVVKQKQSGVHTQLLYTNADLTTVTKAPGKATEGDSIVISGATLKEITSKYKQAYLLLLTTRDDNSVYDKNAIPTNNWYELRKAKKEFDYHWGKWRCDFSSGDYWTLYLGPDGTYEFEGNDRRKGTYKVLKYEYRVKPEDLDGVTDDKLIGIVWIEETYTNLGTGQERTKEDQILISGKKHRLNYEWFTYFKVE